MMKKVLVLAAAFAACGAGAITATKDYVDRKNTEIRTNTYTRAETDARIGELAPRTSLAPATNYTDAVAGSIRDRLDSGIVNAASTAEFADVANHADGATLAEGLISSQGEERTASEVFAALDGASHITTNDVRDIVTNVDVETQWVFTIIAGGEYTNPSEYHIVEFDDGFGVFFDTEFITSIPGTVEFPFRFDDGLNQATVEVDRKNITRNALGLARLVDLPTNHVTRAEMEEAIDAIPEVDLSRFATKSEFVAVSNESALVTRLYTSSNVLLEVTNFNSAVNSPRLRLLQLDESNTYHTVWAETNNLTRTLAAATNYTDRAVSDAERRAASTYAPRAWSGVTSGLGVEAPSNTTWISTPTTVIAGGLEYTKVVDSGGAIWVLSGNGMMQFDPTTNAYLRISADDGTEIFSIEKTDAVTVGAYAAGIQVYDGEYEGIRTFLIPVNVVTDSHPTMYYRQSLNDAVGWRSETEINAEHGDMTVEWSGGSGEWHCLVFIPASRVSGFFKFTYEKPGSTLIRHGAPMDVSGGIMCTDGVHKVRPVYNNGSITWEVVP